MISKAFNDSVLKITLHVHCMPGHKYETDMLHKLVKSELYRRTQAYKYIRQRPRDYFRKEETKDYFRTTWNIASLSKMNDVIKVIPIMIIRNWWN